MIHNILKVFIVLGLFAGYQSVPAKNTNEQHPIYIESDSVSVDDSKGLALYKGNVQFKQDNLIVRANHIKVFTQNGGLQKIYIYGKPARFTRQPKGEQKNVIATANRIEYFANSEILHMYGEALLQQGQQKFSGEYIQYNSRTSQIHANGDTSAKNQNGQGRVKAVITPKRASESP